MGTFQHTPFIISFDVGSTLNFIYNSKTKTAKRCEENQQQLANLFDDSICWRRLSVLFCLHKLQEFLSRFQNVFAMMNVNWKQTVTEVSRIVLHADKIASVIFNHRESWNQETPSVEQMLMKSTWKAETKETTQGKKISKNFTEPWRS